MKVKVCNLRDGSFDRDFLESIKNTGFAVITHHGIDSELIRKAQNMWRGFFLRAPEDKAFFVNKKDSNMGYKGMKQETALGAKKADLKEFFHWKPGQDIPITVSASTGKLFALLSDLSGRILSVLDKDGGTSYRKACEDSDNTILRSLYYPAMKFEQEVGAVRAAAHEDINFITLLVAASSAGLEVKDAQGNWHAVPHEENSIVVNIGDMLQLASGGRYKSTTHRVTNPGDSGQDRISMPLFVHPHSETLLAEGITAHKFLQERIAAIYQSK